MRKNIADAAKEHNIIEKSGAEHKKLAFWIPITISSIIGIGGIIVAVMALNK